MISVAININGHFLVGRSACNTGAKEGKYVNYKCDDGSVILHNPDDGAVELAVKMLRTIKHVDKEDR